MGNQAVTSLQDETVDYSIFADRSSALTRIIMVFIALLLISAESIKRDKVVYRKRIRLLLLIILISEIAAFGCQLVYKPFAQQQIRKIGVELMYMILNCSLVYQINIFLGHNPSTLSNVFYGALVLVVLTGILPYRKFGRLTYLGNCIISFYSITLLHRLSSYFNNLGKSKSLFENIPIDYIPVTHVALLRLEIMIFVFNLIDYLSTIYFIYGNQYKGWHIVHQISTCICLMYLIKMYIIIVEWRGAVNSNNKNKQHVYNSADQKNSKNKDVHIPSSDALNVVDIFSKK